MNAFDTEKHSTVAQRLRIRNKRDVGHVLELNVLEVKGRVGDSGKPSKRKLDFESNQPKKSHPKATPPKRRAHCNVHCLTAT